MKVDSLPKHLRDGFKMQFGVFRMMESAPNMELPADRVSTSAEVRSSFNIGFEFLKQKAQYIFVDDKHSKWKASTWSRKVLRSSIERDGTAADKAQLPEARARNGKRRREKKNKISKKRCIKYPRRRKGEKRKRSNVNDDSIHMVVDSDEGATLPLFTAPVAAAARAKAACDKDQEIQELRKLQIIRNSNRAYTGVGCDGDGNVLHVSRASNVIPNSSHGMAQFGLVLEEEVQKK